MKSLQRRILAFVVVAGFGVISISAETAARAVSAFTEGFARAALKYDGDDALVKAAFDLYKAGKYDEALAMCSKAAAVSPNDFRPSYISGLVYMTQWKMKSASEAFARAISLKPDVKQIYYFKASADRDRNAREESIAASRKAIELDPNYAEAYEILGEALAIGSKDSDGAMEAFRTAIKLKPDLFKAYTELGIHLDAKKDYKGAEEIYRKAMELDPKKMECRFRLGRVLIEEGRLAEARALWDGRSSDKDNTIPSFIVLLERAEKLKQATDDLAKKPNDPEALLQMGLMVMEGESWFADRRQERAIVYFRKALEVKPGFTQAQYNICKAYIQLAEYFKENNKNVDEELPKLRKLDAKLADEMTEYRKTYSGSLKVSTGTLNQ